MTVKNFKQLCYLLFALSLITVCAGLRHSEPVKLPSFVKICHRTDPLLNVCARNSMNALKNRLNVGIPELFVPPIEPLVVPEMKLNQDSGAIYMHSTFEDIKIEGLSNFDLSNLNIDTKNGKFIMTMHIPHLKMNGIYTMKGKIMMMPLMGKGNMKANFTDVEVNTVVSSTTYQKFGKNYLKIKDVKTKYELTDAKIHLDNLFNGDKNLGGRMNVFINENWQSLSDEIRPLLEKAIADIIKSTTEQLFNTYSYDDLLPV